MSISIAAISAVLLLSLATPFIYFGWATRKANNSFQKLIGNLTSGYNLTINEKEQWRQKFIAIDAVNKKLLFIENLTNPVLEVINLNKLLKISIEVTQKTLKSGETVLGGVILELHFEKGANQPDARLSFYDFETDFSQENDLTRAANWKSKISKACNIQENLKATA